MGLINQGVGITSSSGQGGVSFEVLPPTAGFTHPFKVTAAKVGSDVKVKVRAGTVNNLVPKIGSDYLDAVTPPTLTLTGNGTFRIYLKASTTSVPVFFPDTIVAEAQSTVQSDTNSNGYLLLATVVVDGGVIKSVNQFVYASQVLVRAKPGSADALWSWSSR